MKKFFSDYPVIAVLVTSCLTCFTVFVISVVLIGTLSISALYKLGKAIENSPQGEIKTHTYVSGDKNSSNKILVIPIDGVILTRRPSDSLFFLFDFGYTYGNEIKAELIKAASDSDIKAVVLLIDSPGGTITGSKEISDGVSQYKSISNKPILAYNAGLAASGGYWAAAAADKIIADTGTLTGSIGVIMGPFKYYDEVISEGDITTKNGIDSYYLTAGTDKDLGDPYKKLSSNAKQVLQDGINNEYEIFVRHVSAKRNISEGAIKQDIGALVYDTKKALEYKLIDDVGTEQNAYDQAAEMAKLKTDDYQVVITKEGDFFSMLAESAFKGLKPANTECELCNKMLYLYGDPGSYEKNK